MTPLLAPLLLLIAGGSDASSQSVAAAITPSCTDLVSGRALVSKRRGGGGGGGGGDDDAPILRCTDTWPGRLQPLLRPTQADVGYAWVARKLAEDFNSQKHAQEELDGSPVPAVWGPDNRFYLTDHHHTLAALDYSWQRIACGACVVTVEIICDWRNVTGSSGSSSRGGSSSSSSGSGSSSSNSEDGNNSVGGSSDVDMTAFWEAMVAADYTFRLARNTSATAPRSDDGRDDDDDRHPSAVNVALAM